MSPKAWLGLRLGLGELWLWLGWAGSESGLGLRLGLGLGLGLGLRLGWAGSRAVSGAGAMSGSGAVSGLGQGLDWVRAAKAPWEEEPCKKKPAPGLAVLLPHPGTLEALVSPL